MENPFFPDECHKSQVSRFQNPPIIPLNPGWFVGIPLLDYHNPQYIKGPFSSPN